MILLELTGVTQTHEFFEVRLEVLHNYEDVVTSFCFVIDCFEVCSVNHIVQLRKYYITLFGPLTDTSHNLDFTGYLDAVVLAVGKILDELDGNQLLSFSTLS